MSSSSLSSPMTSKRDYSNIESDLSQLSNAKSKGNSSFLTSTHGSQSVSNTVSNSRALHAPPAYGAFQQLQPSLNPFSSPYVPEYERIRRLMHQVKKAAASGVLEEQVFAVQYKELKSMYLEALSEAVSQPVGGNLM